MKTNIFMNLKNTVRLLLILFVTSISFSNAQCSASFTFVEDTTYTINFEAVDAFAVTYDWDFGDSTSSNVNNPSHIYADTGTYTVCLTVQTYVQGVIVTCSSCETVIITESTASLEGLKSEIEFSVYPNPFHESFFVNIGKTKDEATIQLFDVAGKVVSTKKINNLDGSSLTTISEFQLNKGVYFLVILIGDEKLKTIKLIRE